MVLVGEVLLQPLTHGCAGRIQVCEDLSWALNPRLWFTGNAGALTWARLDIGASAGSVKSKSEG